MENKTRGFLTLVGVQSAPLEKVSELFFVFSHSSRILRLEAISIKLERKAYKLLFESGALDQRLEKQKS